MPASPNRVTLRDVARAAGCHFSTVSLALRDHPRLPVETRARRLSIHGPGPRKAPAVRATLHDAITTACPATMLRLHPDATLYLDPQSAALAFHASALATGAHHVSPS